MENAVDALKISFAVFIFVLALSLAFMVFSQASQTSTKMLFASDATNYYRYSGTVNQGGRIVNSDVVISSMYRYYKESIVVKIVPRSGVAITLDSAQDGAVSRNTEEAKLDYIQEKLGDLNLDAQYLETFDEVKKSGKYAIGEDGTELVTESGQTSIYITYTEQ